MKKDSFIRVRDSANIIIEENKFIGDRATVDASNTHNLKLIRNKHIISQIKKHPFYAVIISTVITTVIAGVILLIIEYGLFK